MTITNSEATIDSLLHGAVDLNCRGDILSTARLAQAAGMGALLFQDHAYSPTPTVETLKRHEFADSGLALASGVTLNNAVGGLNPFAVEHELMLGGRLVSMPTLSAANHLRKAHRANEAGPKRQPAIEVVDASGHLSDDVKEILDIIAERDGVLASGHIHISEIWILFAEARRRGVTRLLANCPILFADAGLTDLRELAGMGVFVEQSVGSLADCRQFDADTIRAAISAATVAQSVLGTASSPNPVETYRSTIRLMLELGYDETEIRRMTSANPQRLLGLTQGKTQA